MIYFFFDSSKARELSVHPRAATARSCRSPTFTVSPQTVWSPMSPCCCSLPAWMVLDGYGRADGQSYRCRSRGDQEDDWQPSIAQVCRSVMALAVSPRLRCRTGTAAWQSRCVCQKWRVARLHTLTSIYSACLLHRAPALETGHARSVAARALLCARFL